MEVVEVVEVGTAVGTARNWLEHALQVVCALVLGATALVATHADAAAPTSPAHADAAAPTSPAHADAAVPTSPATPATPVGDVDMATGPKRIDFDERLIKGQTAQAGSVIIFDRQALGDQALARRIPRMRGKIIRSVFDPFVTHPRAPKE